MKIISRFILFILFLVSQVYAQEDFCAVPAQKHLIHSNELKETRAYWVSLPLGYSDSLSYPVIYVLDAEWRFGVISTMAFDLGGNHKIHKSIIVGIPHIDWKEKRGIDLTFSHSRMQYDGEAVDSTWYNKTNSGGGIQFYNYLVKELIPDINKNYASNQHETFIGHSYGGYFGAYLLSMNHPFEVIHMYDPSIWYSDGEVIDRIRKGVYQKEGLKLYLTYQPEPPFHKEKIESLIQELEKLNLFELRTFLFKEETHNALFLESFFKGIQVTNKTKE